MECASSAESKPEYEATTTFLETVLEWTTLLAIPERISPVLYHVPKIIDTKCFLPTKLIFSVVVYLWFFLQMTWFRVKCMITNTLVVYYNYYQSQEYIIDMKYNGIKCMVSDFGAFRRTKSLIVLLCRMQCIWGVNLGVLGELYCLL